MTQERPFSATRRAWLAALSGAALPGPGAAAKTPARPRKSKMQSYIESLVGRGVAPGLSVSVSDGRGPITTVAGRANLEASEALSGRGVFRIGSLSKQFTAAAILKLHEDGALGLDDAASRFLPNLPGGERLTVRRLLTHTSGLAEVVTWRPGDEVFESNPEPGQDPLGRFGGRPAVVFAAEPGTRYIYSNQGYLVLAGIVAAVAAKPFGRFIQDAFAIPLGLAGTADDDAGDVVAGRVSGYTPASGGGFRNAAFVRMDSLRGAASLRSTGHDLCVWQQALAEHRVLRAETLQIMLSPATLADGSPAMTPTPSDVSQWAAGIGVAHESGRTLTLMEGLIPGFCARLLTRISPFRSVIVLANSDGGWPDTALRATVQDLALRAFYDSF